MTTLEKQFTEVLIKNSEEAQKSCAYRGIRFRQTLEKFGGVKTAKEIIRKGRLSDEFEILEKAGLIRLTMEALVVDRRFAELFTDDEVNSCYEVLCEYGYYSL
ncbi:MAG: hypothetical protein E7231_07625 [Cellulosilyticum sp.]|nr:hypothetical protein [Cellulosilyticum sp.]